VRDPKPEAALADMREYLGQLKRRGLLADGVELEDPNLSHARAELALEATREPSERRLSDEALDYLLSLVFEKTALAPNRGRPSTRFRDHWIAQAVATGAGYGLTPTRNRAKSGGPHRQPTACAIVATVLAELGINLTETSVEIIWSRRSDVADIHRRQAIGGFSPEDRASEYRARAKAWLVHYAAKQAKFDRLWEENARNFAALERVQEK
jgi:hypothetical protein